MKDLTPEKQGRSSTIQDKSGKCLTQEKEILSRWTEYCSELYNYESCGDNAVQNCSQPPEEDLQPILREEIEIAVASLKKGKSVGVDNIRGGIKKFWASGIFPIQIVQCFTPNVQKCVRYWLHLGSYCWLSLFSHNTWSKIHTPIELAKWTKLSTERW